MKGNRHKFSYARYGNCLFWLLYLWLTGRLSEILVRKSDYFLHFVGITHKRNIVHIAYKDGFRRDTDFKWNIPIMLGRPEIFSQKYFKPAKYWSLISWYHHEYDGV